MIKKTLQTSKRGYPVFLLGFLLTVNLLNAAVNVNKIIKEIQKKYQRATSVRLYFKQISRFKLNDIESEISGSLVFQGREKFRLETEDQVVVSDSKTYWRYNKLENQVLIDYAKKGEQDALLNHFLYNISDHYLSQLLEEIKAGKKKIYVIKLTPKPSEQSVFTSIKIWVEAKNWKIHRVMYTDYNENETEYFIETLQLNVPIEESVFTFSPPEGSEVVDLRF